MTRQEAIEILKGKPTTGDWLNSLDMAIQALEQEPIIDKIRSEIGRQDTWLAQAGYNAYNVDIAFTAIKLLLTESEVNNDR